MARPVRLTAQALAVALVVGLLALLVWRVAHDDTANVSTALDKGEHPIGGGWIDLDAIQIQ